MRKFRIVTDSFSGYEAQVSYILFPFKWFQLNDYNGVNTWDTAGEAMEFIDKIKAGIHKKQEPQETLHPVDFQLAFKSFIKTGICNTENKIWQKDIIDYLLGKNSVKPGVRLDRTDGISSLLTICRVLKNKKVMLMNSGHIAYYV